MGEYLWWRYEHKSQVYCIFLLFTGRHQVKGFHCNTGFHRKVGRCATDHRCIGRRPLSFPSFTIQPWMMRCMPPWVWRLRSPIALVESSLADRDRTSPGKGPSHRPQPSLAEMVLVSCQPERSSDEDSASALLGLSLARRCQAGHRRLARSEEDLGGAGVPHHGEDKAF